MPHKPSDSVTHRSGVCLVGFENPTREALRYLITHVNELQKSLELELILPRSDHPLIATLASGNDVVMNDDFNKMLKEFAGQQDLFSVTMGDAYEFQEIVPDDYIIISLATLSNKFYAWGVGRTSLLALGGWEKSYSPPSLVEYALNLAIRLAASDAVPNVESAKHLGTKGCLFDFNADLESVRLKVLNSFVCSSCEQAMIEGGRPQLADDIRLVLDKTWLGSVNDPLTPAGICKKLGYDLFLTKGIKPSFGETIAARLQSDLVGEIIKLISVVLVAYLLFRLGLKGE